MHIADLYSTSTGLRVGQPWLFPKFYPMPFSRYITINVSTGLESKQYDYWQQVIDFLKPYITNYKIVQIGTDKDQRLNGIDLDLCGHTNIGQLQHVISKSSLHLSGDTYSGHLAAAFVIPCVLLYSVNYKELSRPYWFNPDITVLIESDRHGKLPTFSAAENPKTINFINPEAIVESALPMLKIEYTNKTETIYFGEQFRQAVIESIPDKVIDNNSIPNIPLNIRMDYQFNEGILAGQLSLRKCFVVTDKPIPIDLLKTYKPNIITMYYELTDTHDPVFAKAIQNLGVQLVLYSFKDQAWIDSQKLKYFDYGIIVKKDKITKSDIPKSNLIGDNTSYVTNHAILSNGKLYSSTYNWRNDIYLKNINQKFHKLNNVPDEYEDACFWYLFNTQTPL